nr:hypothetical protein [Janthinobacterium sp. B9-8]
MHQSASKLRQANKRRPPLIWITLQVTAIRPLDIRLDAVHLLPPTRAGYCVLFAPPAINLVVSGAFLLYGILLLHRLRLGLDGLPLVPLQNEELPSRIWKAVAYALLLMAASDLLIALAAHYEALWIKPWVISSLFGFALLSIGLLGIVPGVGRIEQSTAGPAIETAGAAIECSARDAGYMEKLERLLAQHPLYLEPGLTLDRLSRRLGIPAKPLSAAIIAAAMRTCHATSIGTVFVMPANDYKQATASRPQCLPVASTQNLTLTANLGASQAKRPANGLRMPWMKQRV